MPSLKRCIGRRDARNADSIASRLSHVATYAVANRGLSPSFVLFDVVGEATSNYYLSGPTSKVANRLINLHDIRKPSARFSLSKFCI